MLTLTLIPPADDQGSTKRKQVVPAVSVTESVSGSSVPAMHAPFFRESTASDVVMGLDDVRQVPLVGGREAVDHLPVAAPASMHAASGCTSLTAPTVVPVAATPTLSGVAVAQVSLAGAATELSTNE